MKSSNILMSVICGACALALAACPGKVPEEAFQFESKAMEEKVEEEAVEEPAGEEGAMGKMEAKDNQYGIKGPDEQTGAKLAAELSKDEQDRKAEETGVLAYIGTKDDDAVAKLFAGDPDSLDGVFDVGTDVHMIGSIDDGEGTIGLGDLQTIGMSGSSYGKNPASKAQTGNPTVKGSLSKDIVKRVIKQHLNEVRYCHEKELAKNPGLKGTVTIKFIISPTGAVQMSQIDSSTLDNASVETCIAKAVRRWTFPQPKGGGIVIVNNPFTLEPTESKKATKKKKKKKKKKK